MCIVIHSLVFIKTTENMSAFEVHFSSFLSAMNDVATVRAFQDRKHGPFPAGVWCGVGLSEN